MKISKYAGMPEIMVFLLSMPVSLLAQGTAADYERARNLRSQMQGLVYDSPERATWIETSHRFWYRKTVKNGNQFMLVDAGSVCRQGKRRQNRHLGNHLPAAEPRSLQEVPGD